MFYNEKNSSDLNNEAKVKHRWSSAERFYMNNRYKKVIVFTLIGIIIATILVYIKYRGVMSNNLKQEQLQEATECADGFLKAYQSKDKNIGNYFSDKTPVNFNGINGLLAEQFEYKIINVEEVDKVIAELVD